MEFKEDKYFGEVWFKEQPEAKEFCILEVSDNEIYIHTNLVCTKSSYKVDIIYGIFNGLGSLTFVNCSIEKSEIGNIEYKKYNPDYVFASAYEQIDPIGLRLNTVEIENNTINNLIRSFHIVDPLVNKIEIESIKTHEVKINDDLNIAFYKNYGISTSKFGVNINNKGIIKFNFSNEKSVLESIEVYKKFQKFCVIYFSGIEKFNSFKSFCLNCSKSYNVLFYDNLAYTHHQSIFNDNLFKDEISFYEIIKNWYNNEDITYCFDIIIENYLSKKVSNARRFTNSLASFEAFYKLFSMNRHSDLDKRIIEFENSFLKIDENIYNIIEFAKKIVRIRDYYVHGNRKQNIIHDNFDLLHFSLLFDFVVIRELSKELGFNQDYIEIIEDKGASIFKYQMPINRMLNSNKIVD